MIDLYFISSMSYDLSESGKEGFLLSARSSHLYWYAAGCGDESTLIIFMSFPLYKFLSVFRIRIHDFGPPESGCGSVIYLYGSGSESFYHLSTSKIR
jgi:hypothetical protein